MIIDEFSFSIYDQSISFLAVVANDRPAGINAGDGLSQAINVTMLIVPGFNVENMDSLGTEFMPAPDQAQKVIKHSAL